MSEVGDGVLTGLLRERFTPPVAEPTRVGVLGCCAGVHFPYERACERLRAARARMVGALQGVAFEVVGMGEPADDPEGMIAAADRMLADGAAGLVLHHSSYTAGEIGARLGRYLLDRGVPVFSWSERDPAAERLQANSLCCQNFILNMWKRLGVRYAWAHEFVEGGEGVGRALLRFARSVRARRRLLGAKLLHVGGSRVTAFYDGETDELAVMRRFGARFDRVDLIEVARRAEGVDASEVQRLRDALVDHPSRGVLDVPDEQMLRTLRFGVAVLEMAEEGGYLGCTVKSWPELFTCCGCAIDGAVSMLNDFGFTTAEEGEMNGLLSSLALNLVSEGEALATMMDISGADAERDRIAIWHCGACPTRVLKPGTAYDLRRHSILENGDPETAVGQMIEFLLKLGPATVTRYQSPDAGLHFGFEGDFVESEAPFRGAYGELSPSTASAGSIIGTILSEGLDHHWSVGFGRWLDEVRLLNHWLGVEEARLAAGSWEGGALTGVSGSLSGGVS